MAITQGIEHVEHGGAIVISIPIPALFCWRLLGPGGSAFTGDELAAGSDRVFSLPSSIGAAEIIVDGHTGSVRIFQRDTN